MFKLAVKVPLLDGYSVILVKSTQESYSVVCALWPAMGGLTTDVGIGALKAYASVNTAPLQDCATISANISSSIVKGFVYRFDGTGFVQQGPVPDVKHPYAYGLCNGKQTSLTCGMCQDITVAGVPAMPPVCVRRLPVNHESFIRANNRFWLGVGKFSGLDNPQAGVLLPTSIIKGSQKLEQDHPACELTLGSFAVVNFSASKPNWTASYQKKTGSFQVEPV